MINNVKAVVQYDPHENLILLDSDGDSVIWNVTNIFTVTEHLGLKLNHGDTIEISVKVVEGSKNNVNRSNV